jgi:tetratricopeptide (TPR) repeat protein
MAMAYYELEGQNQDLFGEKTIELAQEALATAPDSLLAWKMHYEYGNALRIRALHTPREETETRTRFRLEAIQEFEIARKLAPEEHRAKIDVDIGLTYHQLHTKEFPYREKALQYLEQAVNHINAERFPVDYSRGLTWLGNVLYALAYHEGWDTHQTLTRSCEIQSKALKYRQPNISPVRYAASLDNLALVKLGLARFGNRRQLLTEAIGHLEEAMSYCPIGVEETSIIEARRIIANIGSGYAALAQIEDSIENTVKRIHTRLQSLSTYDRVKDSRSYGLGLQWLSEGYISLAGYQIRDGVDATKSLDTAFSTLNEMLSLLKEAFALPFILMGRYYYTLASVTNRQANLWSTVEWILKGYDKWDEAKKGIGLYEGCRIAGLAYYLLGLIEHEPNHFDKALFQLERAAACLTGDHHRIEMAILQRERAKLHLAKSEPKQALVLLQEAEATLRSYDLIYDAEECSKLTSSCNSPSS